MSSNESRIMRFRWPPLSETVDGNTLKSHAFAIYENKFAILTKLYLILIENSSFLTIGHDNHKSANLLLLHKLDDELGVPTSLIWLNNFVLCLGFNSGTILCKSVKGDNLLMFPSMDGSVQSFKISTDTIEGLGSPTLWILYETGIFRIVLLSDLLDYRSMNKHIKLKCLESSTVNEFVFLPHGGLSFCSSAIPRHMSDEDITHTVLVAGKEYTLSVYTIGGKMKFQHLGKLAEYMKDSLESAVSNTIGSLFGAFTNSNNKSQKPNNASVISSNTTTTSKPSASYTKDKSQHQQLSSHDCDPIESKSYTSQVDFDDPKRRILRLSIDPYGKLLVMSDTLGRALLYDIRLNAFIRLWKGVRDARFAWSEEECVSRQGDVSHTRHIDESIPAVLNHNSCIYRHGLVLGIYAPQLGLLFMYGMKHGPLLRTVPIGLNAQLLTLPIYVPNIISFPSTPAQATTPQHSQNRSQNSKPHQKKIYKCCVVTFENSPSTSLSATASSTSTHLVITVVSPYEMSSTDIDMSSITSTTDIATDTVTGIATAAVTATATDIASVNNNDINIEFMESDNLNDKINTTNILNNSKYSVGDSNCTSNKQINGQFASMHFNPLSNVSISNAIPNNSNPSISTFTSNSNSNSNSNGNSNKHNDIITDQTNLHTKLQQIGTNETVALLNIESILLNLVTVFLYWCQNETSNNSHKNSTIKSSIPIASVNTPSHTIIETIQLLQDISYKTMSEIESWLLTIISEKIHTQTGVIKLMLILDSVESLGLKITGHLTNLNSIDNMNNSKSKSYSNNMNANNNVAIEECEQYRYHFNTKLFQLSSQYNTNTYLNNKNNSIDHTDFDNNKNNFNDLLISTLDAINNDINTKNDKNSSFMNVHRPPIRYIKFSSIFYQTLFEILIKLSKTNCFTSVTPSSVKQSDSQKNEMYTTITTTSNKDNTINWLEAMIKKRQYSLKVYDTLYDLNITASNHSDTHSSHINNSITNFSTKQDNSHIYYEYNISYYDESNILNVSALSATASKLRYEAIQWIKYRHSIFSNNNDGNNENCKSNNCDSNNKIDNSDTINHSNSNTIEISNVNNSNIAINKNVLNGFKDAFIESSHIIPYNIFHSFCYDLIPTSISFHNKVHTNKNDDETINIIDMKNSNCMLYVTELLESIQQPIQISAFPSHVRNSHDDHDKGNKFCAVKTSCAFRMSLYSNLNDSCNKDIKRKSDKNIDSTYETSLIQQTCIKSFVFMLLSPFLLKVPIVLSEYYNHFQFMGLQSGIFLSSHMQLFVCLFQFIPFSCVTGLLLTDSFIRVFQRWLRDIFLDLQETYIQYTREIRENNKNHNSDFTQNLSSVNKDKIFEVNYLKMVVQNIIKIKNTKMSPTSTSTSTILTPEELLVTFDEIVSYMFGPALEALEMSLKLDASLVFAVLVHDSLGPISDILEKRTYGLAQLSGSINLWKIYIRKLRIVLMLSAREQTLPSTFSFLKASLTIHSLNCRNITEPWNIYNNMNNNNAVKNTKQINENENNISIYALLALDSLCFSIISDISTEHEKKCLEAILQKRSVAPGITSTTTTSSSSSSMSLNKPSPLPLIVSVLDSNETDERWKEMFHITQMDLQDYVNTLTSYTKHVSVPDSVNVTSTSTTTATTTTTITTTTNKSAKISAVTVNSGTNKKKKKPMLLFFPYHNNPIGLGAYRSLLLLQSWLQAPARMELYSSSVTHIALIPSLYEKAAVAYYIYTHTVFPVMQLLLALCEVTVTVAPNQQEFYYNNMNSTTISCHNLILNSLNNVEHMKVFVQRTVELIGHLASYRSDSYTTLTSGNNNENYNSYGCIDQYVSVFYDNTNTNSNKATMNSNSLHNENSSSTHTELSTSTSIWPPVYDKTLSDIFHQFNTHISSITKITIDSHLAILFLLQLRLECDIYNIKPSEVLGKAYKVLITKSCVNKILKSNPMNNQSSFSHGLGNTTSSSNNINNNKNDLSTNNEELIYYNEFINDISIINIHTCYMKSIQMTNMSFINSCNNIHNPNTYDIIIDMPPPPSSIEGVFANLDEIRKKFLRICFHRLPLSKFTLVMKFSLCLNLDLDYVRVIHITTLLDRCLADADEIVDDVLSHMIKHQLAIDGIIQGLKTRVGTCLAHIDKIPEFVQVLLKMDSDAYTWARTDERVIEPSEEVVRAIMNHDLSPIGFDLDSTQYLVLRIQNIHQSMKTQLQTTPNTIGMEYISDYDWLEYTERYMGFLSHLCSVLHLLV